MQWKIDGIGQHVLELGNNLSLVVRHYGGTGPWWFALDYLWGQEHDIFSSPALYPSAERAEAAAVTASLGWLDSLRATLTDAGKVEAKVEELTATGEWRVKALQLLRDRPGMDDMFFIRKLPVHPGGIERIHGLYQMIDLGWMDPNGPWTLNAAGLAELARHEATS